MKIQVKVIANSKAQSVAEQPDGSLKVRLKAKPIAGKANAELIQLLAEYYKVNRFSIQIVQGQKGGSKIVEINKTAAF